jgi:hypothetical protein
MTHVGLTAPHPAIASENHKVENNDKVAIQPSQTTPSRRRRKKSGILEEVEGKQSEGVTLTAGAVKDGATVNAGDDNQRVLSDRGERSEEGTNVNALSLTGATQSMSVAAVVSKLTSAQQAAAVVSSVLLKENVESERFS